MNAIAATIEAGAPAAMPGSAADVAGGVLEAPPARSYRRETDGAKMVEIAPHRFVNERAWRRLQELG